MTENLLPSRTWPGEIDETLKALQTQYQFRSDAIVPRNSHDAPTIEQICLIRDAHLNIYNILSELSKLRTPAMPYQEAVEKVAEMVLANIREQVGGHSIRSSKSDNLIIHTGGSIDLTELAKAALAALGIVEGK